ncbi:putative uncharacterized protein DDB_G0288537 [Belonocnema kinseyi]|uniref:putative uncharacterized protein DDB_G0288537 n=1 Tax=Belonocnema kinseyi TaxID=2817044 RepID=UPI00143CC589|nr:putative uncharacterized protein DDB_G0288537 [Belonocnema kinseyi]
MKSAKWIGWLLAMCVVCFTEARYKIRRPMPPPPPQIYKKSWPIGPRISMGNTVHINSNNYPPKRPPPAHKPNNYRIRRPPVFNVVPNGWKTHQIPAMGVLNNHATLPQRPPVKEFHSLSKVPEYSPEYRPEAVIIPSSHRGGIDDDKGPIHTIPAPNLSPADKPYNLVESQASEKSHHEDNLPRRPYESTNIHFPVTSVTQRPVTSASPTLQSQHQYEVTETNDNNIKDYHTVPPAYYTPEYDSKRVSTIINPEVQANEVYLNHSPSNTGLIGTNTIQFGQLSLPMQTNLHSSLSVGFPGTASQVTVGGQQLPDLHVGHPAPAGPPLSATQLYDLLNHFPQQLTEQYTSGQQPQLQQHILQQQLGQFFQTDANGVTRFSQPQMHSFNYDEQANKKKNQRPQQQILIGQDYGSGRVTADYNLEPEAAGTGDANSVLRTNEEFNYPAELSDQQENNIEYEQTLNQRGQSTYYNKVNNPSSVSSQFYTTLPNREAAEKLAALAAAGNVNSHLIGQLKKQQEFQQDEPVPENHKDESYRENEQREGEGESYDQQQRFEDKFKQTYQQQKFREQQIRQEQENEEYEKRYRQQQRYQQPRQNNNQEDEDDKHPLRIMVPDNNEEYEENKEKSKSGEKVAVNEDYEYENDEPENPDNLNKPTSDEASYEQSAGAEFGTRLKKSGK